MFLNVPHTLYTLFTYNQKPTRLYQSLDRHIAARQDDGCPLLHSGRRAAEESAGQRRQ